MNINIINNWNKIKFIIFLNGILRKLQQLSIKFKYSVASSVSNKLVAEKNHQLFEMMNIYFVNCREKDYT